MSFVVMIDVRVRPGGDEEFRRVARLLAEASATEPGTLRYQWFTSPTPDHYAIIEEYVDADAAETHNGNVGALLAELFAVAELASVKLFGELNAYLRAWVAGRPGIAHHLPL